jgi:hypothetical protein
MDGGLWRDRFIFVFHKNLSNLKVIYLTEVSEYSIFCFAEQNSEILKFVDNLMFPF